MLGGTRFLGRHIVEALAQGGHAVVAFHRGATRCVLPAGVEERFGDRNSDLRAVKTDQWDAIVDVAASEPDQVRRSLEVHAHRYLFVSTVNVYGDLSQPNIREGARTIEKFDPADEAQAYGGKKAACERRVLERFPQSSIVLRPGLIVGKWDPTGRFTYWCERLMRGGLYLAPKPQERPVQLIDAADIARFVERALATELSGIYNLVGPPEPTTMKAVLDICTQVASERGAPSARAVWLEPQFLIDRGVQEWIDMPLWLVDPTYAGILQVSNAAALAAGFEYRPLAQTVHSILDWTESTPNHKVAGLRADRELELLSAAHGLFESR